MAAKPHTLVTAIAIALFILASSVLGVWVNLRFVSWVTDEQGYKYTVRQGASMHSVIDELSLQGIIKHPSLFKLLVRIKDNAHELKSGEYLFPKGASATKILEQITLGTGALYHTFTIIPGWNFSELRKTLLQTAELDHDISHLSDDDIMRLLGSTGLKPEGEFYPDTYYFSKGYTDLALLKRAHHAMQEKLKTLWEHRDPQVPYKTSYDALIVASLIEKEAEVEQDRFLIAGVIINRLNKEMLLQIDPTVIYGMGSRYNGIIHKSDLLEDTPYNTYIHKGLPPTPIAMPGLASLEAAMHPAKHEFYYFVVKGIGEASHQFSKTLEDHYKAVVQSKKNHQWFFNEDLIQHHLLNLNSADRIDDGGLLH